METEWLKLRAQVVLLNPMRVIAGCLNWNCRQRCPVWISPQTVRMALLLKIKEMNARLEVKKTNRINAEARANLLLRDLNDLNRQITKSGYKVLEGSIISQK